ncbi:hypothetical protein AAU57_07390 [Nonlabens sp. YIK11]|uniref:hypothetical protein n=1 Tax=Nonlabens sp. YIK11 TaxID=1453349 RepID=UPI0006DCA7E9|nr:hypothetical protein [Nonlabens sp. YIK11]KQC33154.1 hypothetical protein AAU57_07390 [Nonlabens sp. YIK11]
MKMFVKLQNPCAYISVLMVFAFAKANSQTSPTNISKKSYSITKDSSREELFGIIDELKTDHKLEVKLFAYQRNENHVKELGIAVKPVNEDWIEYVANNENGIDPICMVVGDGSVDRLSLCNEPIVQPEIANTLQQPSKILAKSETFVPSNITRTQQLDSLRAVATLASIERQSARQEQQMDRVKSQNEQLEQIKETLSTDADSIKTEKALRKKELQELQIEVNRSRRERQTLAYNNERAEAKRDSLQAQQQRLQETLLKQEEMLAQALAQQARYEELIKKQQEVIEEQGLKSETAESLKAYRKAMLGEDDGSNFKSQGYLIFALEQCLYKVYDGYSIVYGNQGNFLFTINQELKQTPMSGTLKIQGESFTYNYSGNVLYIKNEDGDLVNQNGEPLDTLNKF